MKQPTATGLTSLKTVSFHMPKFSVLISLAAIKLFGIQEKLIAYWLPTLTLGCFYGIIFNVYETLVVFFF